MVRAGRRRNLTDRLPLGDQALLYDGSIGSYRPIATGTSALNSNTGEWPGFHLEYYRKASVEIDQGFIHNPLVILHLGSPCPVRFRTGGEDKLHQAYPGTVTLLPAGQVDSFHCLGTPELLLLSLGPAAIMCAGAEAGVSGKIDFLMQVGVKDQLASAILMSLKTQLESNLKSSPTPYPGSLCNSLTVHLIRECSSTPVKPLGGQAGLPRHLLRSALDFIYENSRRNVTLKEIADVVGMSPFHFSRLFKQSTGDSPYRHLLRHRVGHGAELLLTTREAVAFIATSIGFTDQSHFAYHFKKTYGMTPREFVLQHQNTR